MARTSIILDQHGRPAAYGSGLYDIGRYERREFPQAYYYAGVDTEQSLDAHTFGLLRSAGRFLFANVPILRGGILEQANFSLPLSAHYAGKDKDWGKLAEEWVYEWQRNCNVRGPQFNSQVTSRLRLIGRKVDGDIGTVLVRSNRGDFPKVQLIRSHRIADRYGYAGVIKKGPFRGKISKLGVVYDDWMRPLGYCVLGAKEEEDQWVSANDMFLSFRPDASDIIRAPSELCACIKSFADIKRLREYEMRAQQIFASIALLEMNDTGYSDEGAATFNTEDGDRESGILTEEYEDGLIKHFKARSGNGLTAFRSDRPSTDAQAWEDKIVAQAFYGIEWDPDFAMCLKQPGGAWVRAKMRKIGASIGHNVAVEKQAQEIEIGFAVGQAIADGVLPMPKDGDFHSWEIALGIPLPTADSGNEQSALREAYKIGFVTLQAVAAQNGGWWMDQRDQKEVEVRDLITRATDIKEDFPELSVREIMFLIEQREANSKTEPAAPVEEPAAAPANEEEEIVS